MSDEHVNYDDKRVIPEKRLYNIEEVKYIVWQCSKCAYSLGKINGINLTREKSQREYGKEVIGQVNETRKKVPKNVADIVLDTILSELSEGKSNIKNVKTDTNSVEGL